jgi:hypothetical protein
LERDGRQHRKPVPAKHETPSCRCATRRKHGLALRSVASVGSRVHSTKTAPPEAENIVDEPKTNRWTELVNLPGGSVPGGGFKPTIPSEGGSKTNFPQGIGDAPKKAAIDIDGVKFNPDTGLPSGGGLPSTGTVKTPVTTTTGKPVLVVTPTNPHPKKSYLKQSKASISTRALGCGWVSSRSWAVSFLV